MPGRHRVRRGGGGVGVRRGLGGRRGHRPFALGRRRVPPVRRVRRQGHGPGPGDVGYRQRGRGDEMRRGRRCETTTRPSGACVNRARPAGHERAGAPGAAVSSFSLIDRVPSGNPRLDEILNGGLLKNAINLIVGVPGSGKTILSQQFAFHNATTEKPALYLSTLSEPLDKILRFGETLEVFDHKAIEEGRVIYEDLGHVLGDEGLENILGAIEGCLKEIRPGIVVIDSFRAFAAVSHDTTEFRRFLYSRPRLLGASATTAVCTAPYSRDHAMDAA